MVLRRCGCAGCAGCGGCGGCGGLLVVVARAGGQVDGVGLAVRALRAAAQLGRQPRARHRRHALRLAEPAPPLTHATRTAIGCINKNKKK